MTRTRTSYSQFLWMFLKMFKSSLMTLALKRLKIAITTKMLKTFDICLDAP